IPDISGALCCVRYVLFFFSSRRGHTRSKRDWSSDVCSSDLYMKYEHHFLYEDVKRAQNEHECFKYLIQKSLQQVEDGNLKKAKEDRKSVVKGKKGNKGRRRKSERKKHRQENKQRAEGTRNKG